MRARVGFRFVADANHGDLAALAVGKNTGLALVMVRARLALRARAAKLAAHRFAFVAPDVVAATVALSGFVLLAFAGARLVGTKPWPGIALAFVATRSRAPVVSPVRRRYVIGGRPRSNRPGKLGAGRSRDPRAELLAQMPGRDFLDRALGQLAQLERPVGHADQAVDR